MDIAGPDAGHENRKWAPAFALSGLLILLLGLVLRIAGARGELWIDEIWSLHLIDEMKARGDLLWGIANDNDHYLNTLYLFLLGPDASPLAQRAFSILLGLASIAAAGLVQRRHGAVAILAAMCLFAIAYPFVNYGSEARGYSGLILCGLVSIGIAEGSLLAHNPRRNLVFGAVNTAGILFQPIMFGLIVALAAWQIWTGWRETGSLRQAVKHTLTMFSWTARFLIPVVAVMAVAIVHVGGYAFGSTVAFDPLGFATGYGQMFQTLLGLPSGTPWPASVAIVLVLLGSGAAMYRQGACPRYPLYLLLIALLPIAMFLVRLPNTQIPRYHLFAAIAALLLISDSAAHLWRRGRWQKCLGVALIGAIVVGNAIELGQFHRFGRGNVTAALREMGGSGPIAVTSNMARDRWILGYFAARLGRSLDFSDPSDVCKTRPVWLLTSDARDMPETTVLGSPQCTRVFKQKARYPSWGLSGTPWTLYRAAD